LKLDIYIGSETHCVDTADPIDISIPVQFNGKQPNAFDVPCAKSEPYRDNHFVGDTREGGSCNFEVYTIIPHCNGTHTEGIGHLARERIPINKIFRQVFLPATLITLQPIAAKKTSEQYLPEKNNADLLLTRQALEQTLSRVSEFNQALIIRTLPNDETKKSRRYMDEPPPFFSIDAIRFLNEMRVEHLLVDTPSLDRPLDDGKLTAHHIYWSVPLESNEIELDSHSMKTITEMIYVPNSVKDGRCFINIQIPNFIADAAPSRVLLYSSMAKK